MLGLSPIKEQPASAAERLAARTAEVDSPLQVRRCSGLSQLSFPLLFSLLQCITNKLVICWLPHYNTPAWQSGQMQLQTQHRPITAAVSVESPVLVELHLLSAWQSGQLRIRYVQLS